MLQQKVNISLSFLSLRCSPRASGSMQMRHGWGMVIGSFMGHRGMRILPTSVNVNGKLAALGSDVWLNIAKDIYSETTAHKNTSQNCRLCLKDQKGLFIWVIKIKPPSWFGLLGILSRAVARCFNYDVFPFPTKNLLTLNSRIPKFLISYNSNRRWCPEIPCKWPLNMSKAREEALNVAWPQIHRSRVHPFLHHPFDRLQMWFSPRNCDQINGDSNVQYRFFFFPTLFTLSVRSLKAKLRTDPELGSVAWKRLPEKT